MKTESVNEIHLALDIYIRPILQGYDIECYALYKLLWMNMLLKFSVYYYRVYTEVSDILGAFIKHFKWIDLMINV